MAGTSYPAPACSPAPVSGPVAVISPQFCVGYVVDLTIVRKLMTLSEGGFGVADVNGNIIFRVKGKIFSLHDRRVLLDAAGNPIITFQQKVIINSFFSFLFLEKYLFGSIQGPKYIFFFFFFFASSVNFMDFG